MDSALKTWQQNGGFVTLKPLGLRVFYRQWGNELAAVSDTVLLIHGFPESSFSFHKVVDGLGQRFDRVVAVDLPGYGFSDKPGSGYSYSLVEQADSILKVWHQLGVQGGHVISHDMGTSVLTELLARQISGLLPVWFSSGLKSITFTNGSMVLSLAKLRLMQVLLLHKRIGPLISQQSRYSLFKKTVLSAHGAKPESPHALTELDIQQMWQSCVLQDGHRKNHHIIRYLNDRKRFEQTRWLPALRAANSRIPIHFCWGDADRVARLEMAKHLQSTVAPDAVLTILPGVGHFCQISSPTDWLDGVLRFFDA